MHIIPIYVYIGILSFNLVLLDDKLSLMTNVTAVMSSAISLDSLKAKEWWHSQTQYIDSRKLSRLY